MRTKTINGKEHYISYANPKKPRGEWLLVEDSSSEPEPDVVHNKDVVHDVVHKEEDVVHDVRHTWKIPASLHESYKAKWTAEYGERGMIKLLEALTEYFDEVYP